MNTKQERLSGWGNYPAADCAGFRPEKERELADILALGHPVIARGLGRSYGDASLQPTGALHMERLDHFLDFDASQGILRAQSGVTLAEIMRVFVPRGWLPPVIPGTQHVTLGGMAACNVHGKNHFKQGDFGEHILGLRLLLASGESVECSPQARSDLFWATLGGMGMTGIIQDVTFRLMPITSASLKTTAFSVPSIEAMLAAFGEYKDSADYTVGWIDHMARGEQLGRGVFEAASHMSEGEGGAPLAEFSPQSRFSVPFSFPSFTLNRYTMALYNRRRFGKYAEGRKAGLASLENFFHPLDAIGHWNRLYGRRGFFQYQCLLPETPDIAMRLHGLLAIIQAKNAFSFLAVVKYHRDGKGLLTFSRRGYSLALDFPNTAKVRALLPELDQAVSECGGRVYLAKDALLSPELFYRMYGEAAEQWRRIIHDCDPQKTFRSLMSDRLQWK